MNPGPASQRLFLALFVPEALHPALGRQARSWLPAFGTGLRAVPERNLHLTLAFLGNVPEENRAPLVAAVREICSSTAPLNLRIAGCGAFPDARRPRTLWAGIDGDLDALSGLVRVLRAACGPLAPKLAPNPFTPHLALARPGGTLAKLPIVIRPDTPVFGGWTAESVVLAESFLGGGPPRYEERDRFHLGGGCRTADHGKGSPPAKRPSIA
jgi:2'-5' RNA ligase